MCFKNIVFLAVFLHFLCFTFSTNENEEWNVDYTINFSIGKRVEGTYMCLERILKMLIY